MKICFYWFNLSTPPGMSIGVSILARELSDAGHDVVVLHLNEQVGLPFDPALLTEHTRKHDFQLHALSFGYNHFPQAMQLASLLKNVAPDSKIICGGVHTTLNAEDVLRHSAVDYVGIGEVDRLLVRFVDALESGSAYDSVPNFWVKQGEKIIRNPIAGLPDIANQTFPYFDGIDYASLIKINRGFADTLAGRGCPMKCSYCHNAALVDTYRKLMPDSSATPGYCRLRRVENLIDELIAFKNQYSEIIRGLFFVDDRFASDYEWLKLFAARYIEKIGLPFICNAMATQINEKTANLLADAGCNMAKFGVESGSKRVRREVLNRQLSEPRLAETVRLLHDRGVNTRAYAMLGIPTETPEEMMSTIRLCAELRFDSVRPAIMCPYPGTEIHRFCVEQNLIDDSIIPTNYSTTTVLRLPEPERIRIEKTAALYPWLLNAFLGGEAAAASRQLVDRVNSLPDPEWSRGEGRKIITDSGRSVHESLSHRGIEHYHASFPDRQDVIFLYRHRARPLINVEDTSVGE